MRTEDLVRAWTPTFDDHGVDELREEFVDSLLSAMPPIDMVLHCPACGRQHIDEPEVPELGRSGLPLDPSTEWTNPPHRSHLCHHCGAIWRPADVATNGVLSVRTRGKADTWPRAQSTPQPADPSAPTS